MEVVSRQQAEIVGRATAGRLSGWPQLALVAAGIYNILFGAWAVLSPQHYFALSGLSNPQYPAIWQCVGMIVGVYGLGYLIAATDPIRHWPIVFVGFLGKVFGPIGYVFSIYTGEFGLQGAWLIVLNDLIWLPPFLFILLFAFKSSALSSTLTAAEERTTRMYDEALQEIGSGRALIVFLRHSGCCFTDQWLLRLKELRGVLREKAVNLVIVHMGTRETAKLRLVEADMLISDPDQVLYRSYGLRLVSFFNLLNPRVWFEAARCVLFEGCAVTRLEGNGFQLPGMFYIEDREVKYQQRAVSVADEPLLREVLHVADGSESPVPEFEVFFDGDCPLCSKEIQWLQSRTGSRVLYTDISDSEFVASEHGLTQQEFMDQIRGRLVGGDIITGVPVFRELYNRAGLGWLAAPTRWPVIGQVVEIAYGVFAKYRLRVTGRSCRLSNSECEV